MTKRNPIDITKTRQCKLPIRFWAKVQINQTTRCWEWAACGCGRGYGKFCLGEKMHFSHRLSWQHFNGIIPNGMHVLHKCDNRSCVNPKHLFLGTNADNVADRQAKGRQFKKLTDDEVIAIRSDSRSLSKIAVDYGVWHSQISRIKNRLRRSNVP